MRLFLICNCYFLKRKYCTDRINRSSRSGGYVGYSIVNPEFEVVKIVVVNNISFITSIDSGRQHEEDMSDR